MTAEMSDPSPTVNDVAARAGVAPSTVSNVLNNPHRVREKTRLRVEAAIAELGFVRNSAARGLRLGRTDAVGLVLVDIGNSLFVDIARGAQAATGRHRLKLLIANSDMQRPDQDDYLNLFDREQVAGILLTPVDGPIDTARSLQRQGRPLVLINAPDHQADICSVMVDEELGGYIATRHLIGQGARRLAFLAGFPQLSAIKRRLIGARRAADEFGLPLLVEEVSDLRLPSGREHGRRLLESDRADGFVCTSDAMAIGVVDAANDLGVHVPGEVLVIGYDDNRLAAESAMPVSSISQRGEHLADAAVALLAEEIQQPAGHRHRTIEVPPHLVARRSSLRRPQTAATLPL